MIDSTAPTVTLTRLIEAPVERVFRAWTDPDFLKRWLAPTPCEVLEVETDVRPGGRYAIVVVEPDGTRHRTTGVYREVVPGRLLVKTWAYDGPYGSDETPSLVTVTFRDAGNGVTELTVSHSRLRDSEVGDRVGAGWRLCLGRLEEILDPGRDEGEKGGRA